MAEPTSTIPVPSDSDSLPMRRPSAEPKPLDTVEDATSMTRAMPPPSAIPAHNKDSSSSKPTVESDSAKTNGDAPATSEPTEEKPTELPVAETQTTEGTEMKDQEDSGVAAPPSSDPAAPDAANGTPASTAKKAQGNGKRKSTGGVPEHRGGKKLNKKKSKMLTHLEAEPGEYYFARLKSYPPWPSIICDEQMLPQSLLTTRPVTTRQIDGTYREPYADGGKRAYERTFPVMFLHTNEFAWIPNTDLTPLKVEDVSDFSEKSKSKALVQAYHVAAEQHELQHFKEMLADHMRAIQEDNEAREAKAAERAAKAAKKGKRKSTDAADDDGDVEMDDAGDEEDEAKPKSSKKRKKDADSEGEAEKPAKTPKTSTKLKLSTPKTPATTVGKKKELKASKPKATSAKKAGKESTSTDEGDTETPKEPEKPLNPQELQQKKEKEVLYLRHKLQKGLLTRDQVPKEEEMASMSEFIQKLEHYPDLEVSTIRTTKINKVLKAIIKLPSIPKDSEYNIRSRSVELLGKWNILLSSSESGPSGDADGAEKDEPTTNGVHKEDGEDTSDKADESTEPKVEEKVEEKSEVPTPVETLAIKTKKPEEKSEAPTPVEAPAFTTEKLKEDVEMAQAPNEAEALAPAAVPEEKPAEAKKETLMGETSEAPVPVVQPVTETSLETPA